MLLEVALAVLLGAVLYMFLSQAKEETLPIGDGWWGEGQRLDSKEDETVRPFKVETSEEEINDLYRRIDETRFPLPLEKSCFHYGFHATYLRKVVSYWRNQFSWQKQVEILNKYPHFKTRIEGIDIHFVHVKPPHVPQGCSAKPLLMVHGWPGSFYEFYKVIPLLTDPAGHSLSEDHIFEVICPSIPGYGFSEASHKQGCDSVSVARIFYKLMQRLGFSEFYAHGGDWGSLICTNLAQIVPTHVRGLHVNVVFLGKMKFTQFFSILLGQHVPRLFGFQDEDVRRMYPFLNKVLYKVLKESGYLHLQATKPDTVGYSLNNSPVGLAAYILEKFSSWTDSEFQNLEDGGLERKFSLDDLLTNVMLYWVTGCITSSMRFYKENLGKGLGTHQHDKVPVKVPTGIASFPNELLHAPLVWVKNHYVNVVSFNFMPRGGHFAALEEPALLAEDIRRFIRKLEQK
ncbi:epoxide hydrolase 1 [Rhinatrema bivittatum]|uniref:epoxide hydrolase 1 n=1 Tax=Rhinatrema bivittatum TaxID=194408 RepID=UPI00112C7611|nr:epoxide hydrolase 1 [Rhinatrema bivittatum]XP_029448937.1 epoxide hydrolase 1 [Rhinatrema bivittatum]XP_029448938.1 epoxide hydrolase 1 [Rhinatrema bivittatum]